MSQSDKDTTEPAEEELVTEGWTQEQDTLGGIYQCVYDANCSLVKITAFVDSVEFFIELCTYALVGALIGWLIGSVLKALG